MIKPNRPSPSVSLPPKELSVFKKIVKHYDQKQYKLGLKYAKQILSNPKFSEHGETLAMKGILLNGLGKREEARDFVKRGLNANIGSFMCWHTYGLIQKSDHNYEQAIKCFLQALKLDPENLQVLRDISVLQMQLRDYEGCKNTRYNLLMLRPSQRPSWLGYAVVHHLLGNHETALTILNEIRKAQSDKSLSYENSEITLYEAMIMFEGMMFEEALAHLDEHSKDIVDRLALLEMKVNILLKLDRVDEAKSCCMELLERNPNDLSYIQLLYRCYGIDPCDDNSFSETKHNVIESILESFPKANLPKRIHLGLISGDRFTQELDAYLQKALRKGVPPLFQHLRSLWDDPEKLSTLKELLDKYARNMETHVVLVANHEGSNNVREPPSTSVWLNYFIAQVFAFKHLYKEALQVIDLQLNNTPTLVDHYALKAEILAEAGDYIEASRWMEEAQSLDTADRFINARCTKLLVQANRLDDSVSMASKFTKGVASTLEYLSEMQCMWYFIENARTFCALGKYVDALNCCCEIEKHFNLIIEDQLDFHSYCLRKETLRSYVETLRLEDRLHGHQSYFDAAKIAIEIYLKLHAKPLSESDKMLNGVEGDGLNESTAKKLRNKQRKAAKRAEADAVKSKAELARREQAQRARLKQQPGAAVVEPPAEDSSNSNKQNLSSSFTTKVTAPPCVTPQDALDGACKFLRPLLDLSRSRIETHCLAYEVFERKGKLLLMLKAISQGRQLTSSEGHAWFHECCVRFLIKVTSHLASTPLNAEPDLVTRVLLNRMPCVFESWTRTDSGKWNPTAFNDAFMTRYSNNFMPVFRATFARCFINPGQKQLYLSQLPLPTSWTSPSITWQDCSTCLEVLRNAFAHPALNGPVDSTFIDSFRRDCSTRFPLANAFRSLEELNELRTSASAAASQTASQGIPLLTAPVSSLSTLLASIHLTAESPSTCTNGVGA